MQVTQNIDKPTCIRMRIPHCLTFVSLSIIVCRSASSFSCLIWSIAMDSSNFFCSCMHETQEECFPYMHRPNKEAFTSSHREAFVHRVRLAFLLKSSLGYKNKGEPLSKKQNPKSLFSTQQDRINTHLHVWTVVIVTNAI